MFWRYGKPVKGKKRKLCNHQGCKYPPFSGGYCKFHQWRVEAKKPIPKYKKRKPGLAEAFGFRTEIETFQHAVYHSPRPIICPVSGRNITKIFDEDTSVWIHCCHHILAKGKYPRWRLNPHNIILVHPDVHHMWHNSTELQRRRQHPDWNWDHLINLIEILKDEYAYYIKGTKNLDNETEVDAQDPEGTQASDTGDEDTAQDAAPGGHGV